MSRVRFGLMVVPAVAALLGAVWLEGTASAQGQALPEMKVVLPPTPNFDNATAPVQHPSGEFSVYGLRKNMSKQLEKDVRVRGYLLYLYECPPEIRKCNEDQEAKAKRDRKKAAVRNPAAPPATAEAPKGGCRPCEQPHFFLSDTPDGKIERAILVADYPIKDWNTGRPKPIALKTGEQYVVTGMFAINSISGFGASNGLLVHKRTEDAAGKVLAEGNAVLPAAAQTINLEGKPPEQLLPAKKK